MNLPNKLTILRVVLIPIFVICMLVEVSGDWAKWVALALFIIASFTDFLDGYIARKRGLVTDFGKFMDPVADKLLVCSAMICFVDTGMLPAWFVIIIISRELIINGVRLVAAGNGIVIAASYWGKIKTVFQILMICFLIADIQWAPIQIFTSILCLGALVLTVVSLVDYLIKNKEVFKMGD